MSDKGAANATQAAAQPGRSSARTFEDACRELGRRASRDFRLMGHHRVNRKNIITMFAGDHYDPDKVDDDKKREWPVNRLHRTLVVLASAIAGQDPISQVTPTTSAGNRLYAKATSVLMTYRMQRANFIATERMGVMDALTMAAIIKTGVAPTDRDNWIEHGTRLIDPGREYICRVSPENWVVDQRCRDRAARLFEGDFSLTTRDQLQLLMDDEEIDGLPTAGLKKNEESAASLTDPDSEPGDDFVEYFPLLHMYVERGVLSREPMVMTFRGDPETVGKIGRQESALIGEAREWTGPRNGPYRSMGFADVPDNPMPTPPAAFLMVLAQMINALSVSKIDGDSQIARILTVDDGQTEEFVNVLLNARNGAVIRVPAGANIQEWTRGGSSERSNESLAAFSEIFSEEAGAAELLSANQTVHGGREITATEVQALERNLTRRLADMEERVYQHSDGVLEDLAYWVGQNPLLDEVVPLRVMGTDIPVPVNARMRGESAYNDYDYKVRRGSMRRRSDEVASRSIQEYCVSTLPVLVQTYMQFAQMGAPQYFDLAAAIRTTARGRLTDEEVDTIFRDPYIKQMNAMIAAMGPSAMSAQGGGSAPPERKGVPGAGGLGSAPFRGNSSPNFSAAQITQNTTQAMQGPGAGY